MTNEELISLNILSDLRQIANINSAEISILENYLRTGNEEYLEILMSLSNAKENVYSFEQLFIQEQSEVEEQEPPTTVTIH